jgi:hypothetical protein
MVVIVAVGGRRVIKKQKMLRVSNRSSPLMTMNKKSWVITVSAEAVATARRVRRGRERRKK